MMRSLKLARPKEGRIDFASNDYLGLARSEALFKRFLQELCSDQAEGFRMGSTGSRLLTGNSSYAMSLEELIATFHGAKAALVFQSGYMANLALFSAMDKEDYLFFDGQIHASTRHGIALSKACAFAFRHGDLVHLEMRLKKPRPAGAKVFVCVESIDSTDGSVAPLKELFALTSLYGAHLIVDEAHSVGVYGPGGRGKVAQEGLTEEVFGSVVTFGKALGVQGAALLISKEYKEKLINLSHPFIYTTAPPFYALAAIRCSYEFFPKMEKERLWIQQLVKKRGGKSHIESILIKGNEAVMAAAWKLSEKGIDVSALRSPTVRKGFERLRISLHAFNTEEEIQKMEEIL